MDSKSKANRDQILRAYFDLFNSELGQTVLNDLREQTIEQPSMPSTQMDGQAAAIWMAHQEGAKSCVRLILKNINKGKEVA